MPRILTPLRLPAYRRLWAGRACSTFGNQLVPVALAFTLIKQRGVSADLGFVLTAESAAYLLSVLWAGVLADRVPRRTRVLLAGEAVGCVGAVGLATVSAHAPLALLCCFSALLGVAMALNIPAFHALIPRLVDQDLVKPAMALQTVTGRVAGIVAPAVAGLVVTYAGPHPAFWLDAATFLVAAINLLRIDETPVPAAADRESVLREAREGLRAVWRRPWIAVVMFQGTVQLAVMAAPLVVLLPLALGRWGELSAYGWLLAVQSAGSVVAAIVLARTHVEHRGTVAIVPIVLVAGVFVCLAVHAPLGVLACAVFVQGAVYSTFSVTWFSSLQTEVPDRLLSRVFALSEVGEALGEPIGLAGTAPLVTAIGLTPVAWLGAVVTVATTLPVFAVPGVRDFRDPVADPTPGSRTVGAALHHGRDVPTTAGAPE